MCTWERIDVCRPAFSVPLMELERDSEGVEEAGGSPTEWVMAFRSLGGKCFKKPLQNMIKHLTIDTLP